MIPIPEVTDVDIAFGGIEKLPKIDDVPEVFLEQQNNVFCDAMNSWFALGAARDGAAVVMSGQRFVPKPGVDSAKALRPIRAMLASFKSRHEDKIAICGWMFSQWFDHEAVS